MLRVTHQQHVPMASQQPKIHRPTAYIIGKTYHRLLCMLRVTFVISNIYCAVMHAVVRSQHCHDVGESYRLHLYNAQHVMKCYANSPHPHDVAQ